MNSVKTQQDKYVTIFQQESSLLMKDKTFGEERRYLKEELGKGRKRVKKLKGQTDKANQKTKTNQKKLEASKKKKNHLLEKNPRKDRYFEKKLCKEKKKVKNLKSQVDKIYQEYETNWKKLKVSMSRKIDLLEKNAEKYGKSLQRENHMIRTDKMCLETEMNQNKPEVSNKIKIDLLEENAEKYRKSLEREKLMRRIDKICRETETNRKKLETSKKRKIDLLEKHAEKYRKLFEREKLMRRIDQICRETETKKKELGALKKKQINLLQADLCCSICGEVFVKPVKLPCLHTFCQTCILHWEQYIRNCPLCRAEYKTVSREDTLLASCIEHFIESIYTQNEKNRRTKIVAEHTDIATQFDLSTAESAQNRGLSRRNLSGG